MPKPLSREFLLDRGWCCSNGCTNCPFDPPHIIKGNTKIDESYLNSSNSNISGNNE